MWLALKIYLGVLVVFSILTYIVYAWDKRQARLDRRRVSESQLHWMEFLGGWPGALVAQQFLHHKNRKLSFQIKFWLVTLAHLALVAGCWALFFRGE